MKAGYYHFHSTLFQEEGPRNRHKPAYTLHKPTGQARVRINGVDHYPGVYGSPESRDAYDDLDADWFARHEDSARFALFVDDRFELGDCSMTMNHAAIIRKPGEGRTIGVVGDVYRLLATGDDTDGKYALIEAFVGPGGGPPPHIHSREEEAFYVLEGEITFTINGERLVATPGMFANMPVGSLHSFKNESSNPAKMLISVAPAGLEQMFLEVGQPLESGATSAPLPTSAEIEKLLAAAPRYGVDIKLPPH